MKTYRQLSVHDAQRGDQLLDKMIFFAALDRDDGFGQSFFSDSIRSGMRSQGDLPYVAVFAP